MKGPEYYDEVYSKPYDWENYRSVYERIITYLPKNKNARILDVGCGVGGFLKVCEEKGYKNLFGFDFSKEAIKKAKKLLPNAHLDIHNVNSMPEKWQCDCAVIIETLEHLEDDIKIIKMLLDFCTKDGYVIGTVPNQQMSPEVTEAHVRMYDERSFMQRFNLPGRLLLRTRVGDARFNFIMFKFWKTIPEPKISYVIPAFMGDHYLSETVQSLTEQTVEEIEIIVVNDGSPDYTDDLMKWWEKQDARIRYFRLKTNKGVVYARNYGNKQARAEIIAVSDQDDISLPQRSEVTLKTFKEHPEISCLYSSYHECDVDGEPLALYDAEPMNREIFEKKQWRTWFHSSAAYKKEDILQYPYKRREGCTDDWVFLSDWTKLNMKFFPIKEVLANCRRLPTGVMAGRRREADQGANYFL